MRIAHAKNLPPFPAGTFARAVTLFLAVQLVCWAAVLAAATPAAPALPADKILESTAGRDDITYLAVVVLVCGSIVGMTMIGATSMLVNRLLRDQREATIAQLERFGREMETERTFHASQVRAIAEHDEHQQALTREAIREMVSQVSEMCQRVTDRG